MLHTVTPGESCAGGIVHVDGGRPNGSPVAVMPDPVVGLPFVCPSRS